MEKDIFVGMWITRVGATRKARACGVAPTAAARPRKSFLRLSVQRFAGRLSSRSRRRASPVRARPFAHRPRFRVRVTWVYVDVARGDPWKNGKSVRPSRTQRKKLRRAKSANTSETPSDGSRILEARGSSPRGTATRRSYTTPRQSYTTPRPLSPTAYRISPCAYRVGAPAGNEPRRRPGRLSREARGRRRRRPRRAASPRRRRRRRRTSDPGRRVRRRRHGRWIARHRLPLRSRFRRGHIPRRSRPSRADAFGRSVRRSRPPRTIRRTRPKKRHPDAFEPNVVHGIFHRTCPNASFGSGRGAGIAAGSVAVASSSSSSRRPRLATAAAAAANWAGDLAGRQR